MYTVPYVQRTARMHETCSQFLASWHFQSLTLTIKDSHDNKSKAQYWTLTSFPPFSRAEIRIGKKNYCWTQRKV